MYLNYRLPDIPVNPIPYPDFFLFTNMCILRRISNSEKAVSYTHLRAHETGRNLVCRLLLEKKNRAHETDSYLLCRLLLEKKT